MNSKNHKNNWKRQIKCNRIQFTNNSCVVKLCQISEYRLCVGFSMFSYFLFSLYLVLLLLLLLLIPKTSQRNNSHQFQSWTINTKCTSYIWWCHDDTTTWQWFTEFYFMSWFPYSLRLHGNSYYPIKGTRTLPAQQQQL